MGREKQQDIAWHNEDKWWQPMQDYFIIVMLGVDPFLIGVREIICKCS